MAGVSFGHLHRLMHNQGLHMKQIKIALLSALLGVSCVAMADDASSDSARQARMDQALQDYHGNDHSTNSQGRFARGEDSVKNGFHRAGSAIEHGAKSVGHAVGTGVHKTGDAIKRTGDKLKSKTDQ
jgi:cytochrome c556